MEKEVAALPAIAENDKVKMTPFNVIERSSGDKAISICFVAFVEKEIAVSLAHPLGGLIPRNDKVGVKR